MFKLTLRTPSQVIFENQEIEKLSLPTMSGINVVLANHENLITALASGVMMIYKNENDSPEDIIIDGGIFTFNSNKAEVLTDFAEKAADVIQADIQAAIDRAKSLINDQSTDIEIADVQRFIFREELKLKYKDKIR